MKKILFFIILLSTVSMAQLVRVPMLSDSLRAVEAQILDTATVEAIAGDVASDSLDAYLQVGDFETIEYLFPLSSARMLYQPVGELALYTAPISEILALGIDSATISTLITDSLGSIGQGLIPKTTSIYDLGSATKQWKSLYLANDIILQSSRAIKTENDGVFFMDLGGVTFRTYNGDNGGYVRFTGYTSFLDQLSHPAQPPSGGNIYSFNGEMLVTDADSNVTQFSPHPKELNGRIGIKSVKNGIITIIDLEKLAAICEELGLGKFYYKGNEEEIREMLK